MEIYLDMYQTITVAVLVLMLGKVLKKKFGILERFCIPAPVIGGVVFAVFTCICYVTGIAEFSFDDILKEVCMVFFFTSVGFQANLKVLKSGGKALIIFLGLVIGLILSQNFLAVGLAKLLHISPLVGLCTGSIPMVGGHGTAGAFGPVLEDFGIMGATTLCTAGATFGLFNEWEQEYTKENAYLTVVSDENGAFKFENVPFGDYVVVELEAPEGYMKSDARHFVSVTYDTQVIGIKAINYLIVGSVQLTKVDAEYPDNKLTGAVFEVFADTDKDGAFDAENDECLGTLTEINEGIYEMTGLLYGNYFVKEKAAPEGFLLDENVYTVSIVNDKEVVMVENEAGVGFMDQPVKGKVTIFKTDDESGEKLVGAGFRICDTEGNAVAEGYTGEEGTVSFELRYGKYTVAEFEAPKGYVLDEAPYSFEVTEHGQKISIDMANTKIKGKIVISKVDADTEELLPDAGFRIYDVNGEVIREGRTDKNGNVEFDLEFGTYYYQEFDAPEGYEVNDEKYEFTITEDGQVLSVIMTNKAIPKETPEEPDEPKKDTPTETPKTPTYTEGPKTGDDADVALWMVLAVLAAITGVGLTVFSVKRKKKDKEK